MGQTVTGVGRMWHANGETILTMTAGSSLPSHDRQIPVVSREVADGGRNGVKLSVRLLRKWVDVMEILGSSSPYQLSPEWRSRIVYWGHG